MEEKGFELKYAPGKCPYFTMGDCMISNYDKSCGIDCDKCDIYNLYQQLQLKDKMVEHCQDIFCLMLEDGVDVEYYKLQALAELEE